MTTIQGITSAIGVLSYQFGTGACFIAGTRVNTATGFKNIEDIIVGDTVLAFDPDDYRIVAEKAVTQTYVREVESYLSIQTDKGIVLGVTQEHPFFLPDFDAFCRADKLSLSSRLLAVDGTTVGIVSIELKKKESPSSTSGRRDSTPSSQIQSVSTTNHHDVYDIKIDDFHTFFVEGIGVHNPVKP